MGYPDNVYSCPNCGNTNLFTVNGNIPSAAPRQSNFYFGQFFKMFFRKPNEAKSILAQKKDYGSAFLIGGMELFAWLMFAIFLQVGMGVRYHLKFDAVAAFLYPFVFFIIIFGFQYLNVMVYYYYSKKRVQPQPAVPGSIFIFLASSRLIAAMVILFAGLVSIGSPILGSLIASITMVILLVYAGIQAKLEYGVKPESFLDSFMFILLGVGFYIVGYLIVILLIYASVNNMVERSIYSFF